MVFYAQREREIEIGRKRETETETQTDKETEREWERETERHRERQRDRQTDREETMGSAWRRCVAPHQRYQSPLLSDIMGSLAREGSCNEFHRCFSLFPRTNKKSGFCFLFVAQCVEERK